MIARQTLLTRVTSLLSQAGWNQRPSHNAGLMTKSYNSALGIRTAYTYLGWLFEGTSSGYLQAEYQCGGRNILATINARVSAQMTDEELSGVVDRFVVAVDAAVAMSHLAYRMIS
jgi:hypothetical protein